MELTKKEYVISKEMLELVLEALGNNWFVSTGDGDEDNNDEIIAADRALQAEISAQQSVQPTLLESGQKFAPESVNPYPCDTN